MQKPKAIWNTDMRKQKRSIESYLCMTLKDILFNFY